MINPMQFLQNAVNQIRPCPVPAYQVANPYAYNNCCNNGCGCNSCC